MDKKIDSQTIERMRLAQEEEMQRTPIYTTGLLGMLETHLKACDIDKAIKMFVTHHAEAMEAIRQFKPQYHKIMERPDKDRIDQDDWETNKLPRCYQRITNNTGTFFMFANPLKLTLGNSPEEAKELQPYFELYLDFLEKHYFYERMYESRRITGSETECAKLYSLYTNLDGEVEVLCRLLHNDDGKILYTLFDEHDKMMAFACGYMMRNEELDVCEHFDVYTKKAIWRFRKLKTITDGKTWERLEFKPNPFNKIPVIYYHHEVDWEGSQPRMDHLEWVDSKRADTNEYFGDPYLLITADIVGDRLADAREVGKVMVLGGSDSRFEFVAPPDCGNLIKDEKEDLKSSIEQDTLTPDWSYKSIMGLGTLSGEAMRRINLVGYVKRSNFAVRFYNELIRRELNLIRSILCDYVYVDQVNIKSGLERLKIKFQYTDPFIGGIEDNSQEIATLVGAGAMSIRAAVDANRHIEDKDAEYERIWEEKERMALLEAKAALLAKKESETKNK